MSELSWLHKLISLFLCVLVFALAVFIPPASNAKQEELSDTYETIALVQNQIVSDLIALPKPPLKLNILLFTTAKHWYMLYALIRQEFKECQATVALYHIRSIYFVFVSTQAP